MKKIGNICGIVILFLSLFGSCSSVFGQTAAPTVEATVSETTVFTGERLQLDVTISGDFSNVKRPSLPDFTNFRLLNNTPSTSRNISYINGVTKSSYTYTYFLQPKSKGSFNLPPVTVNVDGKEYQTKPIDIKVMDRNGSANNNSSNKKPDVFLRLNVSDTHPVTGQQLIADVILFFKEGLEVHSYQPIPGWKAEGFWKEELKNSGHPQVNSTIINGVRYRTARLLQFALFPTKAGKLTISPYQINVSVRSTSGSDDPFSNFFGGYGSNQQQVELKTDPVSINVEPLPVAGNAHYIGAVGSFQINRKVKNTDVETGESIEIKTTINGTGNIPLINKPDYNFPSGLEMYQPQENSDINRSDHRISGSKTYTDIAIARMPGTYTIPAATLTYYNPGRKKYVTETLPARTITVKRNPNATATTEKSHALSLQPITGLASWISPKSTSLYRIWWFWAGLFLPLVAFAVAYWQKSYRDKMTTDRNFARSQKAVEKAQQRLNKALGYAENHQIKEAYNALQKALTGFISDRLALPEAGLSIEQYVAALNEHNVNADLVKNVRMLLNKCATINYAPDSSQDYLKSHVGLAESIIQKLKKEL